MNDFRAGDRVIVLRLDSDDIECHGRYLGTSGPILFVLPDDDDLPDPIEVGKDRVLPEKPHPRAELNLPAHAAGRASTGALHAAC